MLTRLTIGVRLVNFASGEVIGWLLLDKLDLNRVARQTVVFVVEWAFL